MSDTLPNNVRGMVRVFFSLVGLFVLIGWPWWVPILLEAGTTEKSVVFVGAFFVLVLGMAFTHWDQRTPKNQKPPPTP